MQHFASDYEQGIKDERERLLNGGQDTTINQLIHTNAKNAYRQGFGAGREEALHETFTTLELILNDIWEYYYDYAAQREAVCKIQGRVEELKDRLNAPEESR
jgi:hypothetical protein